MLARKHLSADAYEYLDAVIAGTRAPEEAFRRLERAANAKAEEMRGLAKSIQDARLRRDAERVKGLAARYDDALESEMDPMFWASKLHFYMTSPQFYNFPYTFGYLFALGVYAHGESLGEGAGFHEQYVALLRDTGRMTAEELVERHLGVSISEPEFWARSVAIVERKLDGFEAALAEVQA